MRPRPWLPRASLRRERRRARAPLLVDAEELLHLLLSGVEALLRHARELYPLLEQPQRLLQRKIAALQRLDDLGETLDGLLERGGGDE